MKTEHTFWTEKGWLKAVEEDGALIEIGMAVQARNEEAKTDLLKQAEIQLQEYMAGKRRQFDLPIRLEGTDFQLRIWKAVAQIPYGQTCSYKDAARAAGNEKACQAAGQAIGKNPLCFVIPCHRVIGSDGSLTGYGPGLELKRELLLMEGAMH